MGLLLGDVHVCFLLHCYFLVVDNKVQSDVLEAVFLVLLVTVIALAVWHKWRSSRPHLGGNAPDSHGSTEGAYSSSNKCKASGTFSSFYHGSEGRPSQLLCCFAGSG